VYYWITRHKSWYFLLLLFESVSYALVWPHCGRPNYLNNKCIIPGHLLSYKKSMTMTTVCEITSAYKMNRITSQRNVTIQSKYFCRIVYYLCQSSLSDRELIFEQPNPLSVVIVNKHLIPSLADSHIYNYYCTNI